MSYGILTWLIDVLVNSIRVRFDENPGHAGGCQHLDSMHVYADAC